MPEPKKANTRQEQTIALLNQGKFDQAERVLKESLAALNRQSGEYLFALDGLARLYQTTAEYERALGLFEESRKARELALGIDHPEMAIALRQLVEIESILGNRSGADKHASRALAIWLDFLGCSDQQTAKERESREEDMSDLNALFGPRSNEGLAKRLYDAALAKQTALGSLSPTKVMFEIGSLFRARNLLHDARTFLELVLQNGSDFQSDLTVSALQQLAAIEEHERNFKEAEDFSRQRLELLKNTRSSDHPEIAGAVLTLGRLAFSQGKLKDARLYAVLARDSLASVLGEENPDYADALSLLSQLSEAEDDLASAEMLLKKSCDIVRAKFSDAHPLTIRRLNSLTGIYAKQKRFDEAEAIYYRAIDVMGSAIGPQPLILSDFYDGLTNVYVAQGKFAKAESVLQKALTIRQNHLVGEDTQIATTLSELGNLYLNFGKYQDSEGNLKRALAIFASSPSSSEQSLSLQKPEDDEQKNLILTRLAKCHLKQGRFIDAEKLLKQQLDDLERRHPPNSFAFVSCLEALALASLFQYKFKNAQKALERAREIVEATAKLFSPDAASLFLTLGDAKLLANEFTSALEHYEMALAGASAEVDGALVTHVKATRRLAQTYQCLGEKEKSAQLLEEAFLEAQEKLSAKAEEQIRTILQSANYLLETGATAVALTLYKQAMNICDQRIGPVNPLAGLINIHFARWHAARREFRQSAEFYMRATSILDGALGSQHWELIAPLAEFAMVSKLSGALKDAETLLRRAANIAEKALGGSDATTSSIFALLLMVLIEQRQNNPNQNEPKSSQEIQLLEGRLKATLLQSSPQEQTRLSLVASAIKGELSIEPPFKFKEPRQILADALSV